MSSHSSSADRSVIPTLRVVRAQTAARAFDGRFFERSPLFWPIVGAARLFEAEGEWPDVASYGRVFDVASTEAAPVRFDEVVPPPRRKRRDGSPIDPRALYDGRITLERRVPTRARSWHDFINALVWGTFPRSKVALHARQHRALAAHVPHGATRLPGARTRELDALALLDEGGVVVLATCALEEGATESLADALSRGEACGIIFGHALYEGLALDTRAMAARAFVAYVDALPTTVRDALRAADEALAHAIATHDLAPEALPRLPLASLPVPRVQWTEMP